MFHFEIAQVMQIRLPPAVLCKIVGYAFGSQDVPGITAIHHPLRDVDAGAGDVLSLVHIGPRDAPGRCECPSARANLVALATSG